MRLHYKEVTSRPVGLSFSGLDMFSLSLLKMGMTTAGKKGAKDIYISTLSHRFTVTNISNRSAKAVLSN